MPTRHVALAKSTRVLVAHSRESSSSALSRLRSPLLLSPNLCFSLSTLSTRSIVRILGSLRRSFKQSKMSSTTGLETKTFTDEIKGGWDNNWMFDLGHPLLNRVAESFVKAAGIGAIQAVTREGYFITVEGSRSNNGGTPDMTAGKNNRFPNLRGDNSSKSLEELVKGTGKEAFQWGLAAGVYSGLTYGLKEARGTHDWKNSAVAGAITGAALALTTENSNSDHVVQSAVTGAAISTVANLLRGIF